MFLNRVRLAQTFCWAALCIAGCGRSPPTPPALPADGSASGSEQLPECYFVDRSAALGIAFTYTSGSEARQRTILESMGGGVGWLDYDRDGWLDLVATGGGSITPSQVIEGRPLSLFRSINGKKFAVVTSAAIESSRLYTHGIALADYDHDGFADMLVTGYGPPQMWKNLGDGTFLECAAPARIINDLWSVGAGWGDLNGDSHLDLYLTHYVNWSFQNHPHCQGTDSGDRDVCPPRSFEPLPDTLYFSQGDGTFEDASERAGLRADGKGLGVLLADVEPDGDVDIYVANDTTDNFLYLSDGHGGLSEKGMVRGVALDDNGIPNASMGVDLCDYNGDGRPDLWVTNYEREAFALYRNEGDANFLHVSQRLGITDLGGLFVGFGTACEDFDSDGDQDIAVANGHVIHYPAYSPRRQLALLLEFDGRRFERTRFRAGSYFEQPHEGRGLATADFDADGDLDIAISNLDEPLALLANDFQERNRFLSLTLVGTQSNRDAVGARVELYRGAKKVHRQVTGGGSYLSHSARSIHFALPPDDLPRTLVIHWPAGCVQTIDAAALAGCYTLVEPLTAGDAAPRLIAREVLP
jgi:hypothetical protein